MLRRRTVVGELEIRVLNVLWERGRSTVNEVLEALPSDTERHYNTVATVLRRLVERGVASRERVGKSFAFAAEVTREELARHYLGIVREEIYGGSLSRLVAALLSSGKVGPSDEAKLAEILGRIEGEESHGA